MHRNSELVGEEQDDRTKTETGQDKKSARSGHMTTVKVTRIESPPVFQVPTVRTSCAVALLNVLSLNTTNWQHAVGSPVQPAQQLWYRLYSARAGSPPVTFNLSPHGRRMGERRLMPMGLRGRAPRPLGQQGRKGKMHEPGKYALCNAFIPHWFSTMQRKMMTHKSMPHCITCISLRGLTDLAFRSLRRLNHKHTNKNYGHIERQLSCLNFCGFILYR